MLWALPQSVCLFKINRFMYFPIEVALDKSVCKMTKYNVVRLLDICNWKTRLKTLTNRLLSSISIIFCISLLYFKYRRFCSYSFWKNYLCSNLKPCMWIEVCTKSSIFLFMLLDEPVLLCCWSGLLKQQNDCLDCATHRATVKEITHKWKIQSAVIFHVDPVFKHKGYFP